jgi:hypothetical protein
MIPTHNDDVVREFDAIGKYRVRLLRDKGRLFLDIREYLDEETYKGFTRRGVRLFGAEIEQLEMVAGDAFVEWMKASALVQGGESPEVSNGPEKAKP